MAAVFYTPRRSMRGIFFMYAYASQLLLTGVRMCEQTRLEAGGVTGAAAGKSSEGAQLDGAPHLMTTKVPPSSSSVLMHRVFVYGSLKRAQPNYPLITDSNNGKAELLATATTVQKYPLVIATQYNIPFLLNLPGQGHRVHGELYRVDEKMLKYLDWFENVPTMYQRTVVELEINELADVADEELSPGNITEAFVYSTTTYQPDWPSLPAYQSYDSNGDHGLKFVLREDRH
ncbi:gamma-glutamylaminecyclotransferase C-like [Fundulus diaphanus]